VARLAGSKLNVNRNVSTRLSQSMPTKGLRTLRITQDVLPPRPEVSSKPFFAVAGPRMSPASLRVFDIYELLEAILLYLPMRDILLAQRVNRRWRATIESSKPLQRALYFLPHGSCSWDGLRETNPLIASVFSNFFNIFPIRPVMPFMVKGLLEATRARPECAVLLKPTVEEFEVKVKNAGASWRKMLVAQPPVVSLQVIDKRIAPDYHDCFNESVENTEGVRLEDLLVLEDEGPGLRELDVDVLAAISEAASSSMAKTKPFTRISHKARRPKRQTVSASE
jgi:hypothetical protein